MIGDNENFPEISTLRLAINTEFLLAFYKSNSQMRVFLSHNSPPSHNSPKGNLRRIHTDTDTECRALSPSKYFSIIKICTSMILQG